MYSFTSLVNIAGNNVFCSCPGLPEPQKDKRLQEVFPLNVRQAAGSTASFFAHYYLATWNLPGKRRVSDEMKMSWSIAWMLVKQGSTSRIYCFMVVEINGFMLRFSVTRWINKKECAHIKNTPSLQFWTTLGLYHPQTERTGLKFSFSVYCNCSPLTF